MNLKRWTEFGGFAVAGFLYGLFRGIGQERAGIVLWVICSGITIWAKLQGDPTYRKQDLQKAIDGSLFRLYEALEFPDEHQVRCCLWVPAVVKKEKCLIQLTDYVPGNAGMEGRYRRLGVGVIGRAYQKGLLQSDFPSEAVRSSPTKFQNHLAGEWDFRKEEARLVSPGKAAYLAVPLKTDDGKVLGVVYFDATDSTSLGDPGFPGKVKLLAPLLLEWLRFRGG